MPLRPQLFGTDGVRGVAGQFPLDASTVWKLGKALGELLASRNGAARPQVILGEDTRESSGWISRQVAAGIRSAGADVVYAGVITTPDVAFLTRRDQFAAGVMVSASHNPYQDNGIKVFAGSGLKLPEADELELESKLEERRSGPCANGAEALKIASDLLSDYVQYLRDLFPEVADLPEFHIVVDCGNGSASRVVPPLLENLNLKIHLVNCAPNGRNINAGCGALYPQSMAQATRDLNADLGIAFDGDADRAIFATRAGRIADGDHVLYAAAPFMNSKGLLKGDTVVGTLMSNLGLEKALSEYGIGLERTSVGDKYVLEAMLRSDYKLGGEPSGHIIFADLSLAGDGIITLLQILHLIAQTGKSFDQLTSGLRQYPQIICNIPVREKPPLDSIPGVRDAMEQCRAELGEKGRLVVRYSGTELLARVMVEAEDAGTVERHSGLIAQAIESEIGLGSERLKTV